MTERCTRSGWGGRRPGAGGPNKLSDWEIEELCSYRRQGWSIDSLATFYGVCSRTVKRYLDKYDNGPEACARRLRAMKEGK